MQRKTNAENLDIYKEKIALIMEQSSIGIYR